MTFRLSVLFVGGLTLATPAVAASEAYQIFLGPVARSNATQMLALGRGTADAALDGNKLSINGTFGGLTSPATDAHLCQGIGIGVSGTCANDLAVSQDNSGAVSGTVVLNAKQMAALRAGQLYVQINSQKAPAPAGNLWGWILIAHETVGQDVPQQGDWFLPQYDMPQSAEHGSTHPLKTKPEFVRREKTMKLSKKKTSIAVAAFAAIAGIALWAPAGFGQAAAPAPAAPAAPQAAARPAAASSSLPNEYTRSGLIQPGSLKNYTDVTDAMLTTPSPNDWLMFRGNYAGWSYSSLNQINAGNVNQLQLKWTLNMADGGTNETTPLVHDGVMFLWSPGNTVQAIKADTGELLWQNNMGPPPNNLNPGGDVAERSMALYQDKLIVPTMQGKIFALDARTGKVVWETFYSDPDKPDEGIHGNDGGVIVVHGKIITGMMNCAAIPQTGHCYISAYDANTGKRVWKFNTIPNKGEPGGDTWGTLADDHRAGVETWIAGTYDPVLNTTYWGTAQSKPWRRDARGSGDGATLYANSTLALDPDTGKLKWYFSHSPGETLDLDEVFERILIDHGDQKTVMTIGKPGILWKLDRATGKYLNSRQTVFQNIYTKIDPKTGVPTYRKDVLAQTKDQWLPSCPGPAGGKDWPPASYHPPDDTIIIPLEQSCVLMASNFSQQFYEMPGTEGNMGRLSAYETNTMKPLWSLQQRSPFLTGVVSTAGNVAFVGDFDRVVHAFDTKTGTQLWKTRLGTTAQGHIASFAVGGKQYIAVMTGVGGTSPEQKPAFILAGEVNRPLHGNAIYVFGLPDQK